MAEPGVAIEKGVKMAKTSRSDDLLTRLHAQGLRNRTGKLLSQATGRRRKPASRVERTVADMKKLVGQVEERLTGGPEKRRAPAKKAADTRGRSTRRRSEPAKQSRSETAKKTRGEGARKTRAEATRKTRSEGTRKTRSEGAKGSRSEGAKRSRSEAAKKAPRTRAKSA